MVLACELPLEGSDLNLGAVDACGLSSRFIKLSFQRVDLELVVA